MISSGSRSKADGPGLPDARPLSSMAAMGCFSMEERLGSPRPGAAIAVVAGAVDVGGVLG